MRAARRDEFEAEVESSHNESIAQINARIHARTSRAPMRRCNDARGAQLSALKSRRATPKAESNYACRVTIKK